MARRTSPSSRRWCPPGNIILGAAPEGKTPATAAPNHNPAFDFDEAAMLAGAKAMAAMTLEFPAKP